jgi:hypothetical protein
MVKFTASGNGITLIGLGLEDGNLERLKAGQPIRVRLSDLGFTGAAGAMQITIFYGKTQAEMRAALAPFIGSETVIHTEG